MNAVCGQACMNCIKFTKISICITVKGNTKGQLTSEGLQMISLSREESWDLSVEFLNHSSL